MKHTSISFNITASCLLSMHPTFEDTISSCENKGIQYANVLISTVLAIHTCMCQNNFSSMKVSEIN